MHLVTPLYTLFTLHLRVLVPLRVLVITAGCTGRCGSAPAEGTVLAGTGVVLVPRPAVQPVCNPIDLAW